ncbi:MAG: hypothetical protein U0166_15340 [Acidobacteriota bacterium]
MSSMKRLIVFAMGLPVIAPCLAMAADPGGWVFAAKEGDRRVAFVEMTGSGPGGPCRATLVLTHRASAERAPVTKDGATTPPVIAEIWIADSADAKGFDLDEYEGPDAPSGDAKLVTVTVSTKGKAWTRHWTCSGWYSPLEDPTSLTGDRGPDDPLAFVFGLSNAFKNHAELVEMTDLLSAGADAFTIELAGKAKPATRLRFAIPLDGAADAVEKLMKRDGSSH